MSGVIVTGLTVSVDATSAHIKRCVEAMTAAIRDRAAGSRDQAHFAARIEVAAHVGQIFPAGAVAAQRVGVLRVGLKPQIKAAPFEPVKVGESKARLIGRSPAVSRCCRTRCKAAACGGPRRAATAVASGGDIQQLSR